MQHYLRVFSFLFFLQLIASTTTNANSVFSVSATTTDATCGVADGTITITATGGAGGYNYSVDGGATFQGSPFFPGLPAGTYNIFVQDMLGDIGTTTVTINNLPTTLNFTTFIDQPTCGLSDGTITVLASGGSGSYTYSKNNGASFQALNGFVGLAAGTYIVVVNDGTVCEARDTVELVYNLPNIDSIVTTAETCYGQCNGTATFYVSGGFTPYEYSIDGGATFSSTSDYSSLCQGAYTGIVRDNQGCEVNKPFVIAGPDEFLQNSIVVNTSCGHNNGSISINANGGNGTNYMYSVDGGLNYYSTASFTGLVSGNYSIVVKDSLNCLTSIQNVSIDTSLGITATSSATIESCNSGDGTLTVTGFGGAGYEYSVDSGLVFQTSNFFGGLSEGIYTIVVIETTTGCDAVITDTVLNIGTGVIGNVTGVPSTICAGQTAVLTATGGLTYSWSTGSSVSTIAVSPTSTTTYTVNIANALCNDIDTITINVVTPPVTLVSAPDTLICPGETAMIVASGGTAYNWNTGATNDTIYVSPSMTAVYSCVASASGCFDTSPDMVQITVLPAADANILVSPPAVVLGDSIVFSASGTVGTTFYWTFGNGDDTTGVAGLEYTYSAPGTYTVTLTTTLGTCSNTDTAVITVSTAIGVQEFDQLSEFTIYPNPSNGMVQVALKFEQAFSPRLQLFDLSGKIIQTKTYANVFSINEQIDLSLMDSGLYLLSVDFYGERVTKRIEIIK
jgi:hypothetical protein